MSTIWRYGYQRQEAHDPLDEVQPDRAGLLTGKQGGRTHPNLLRNRGHSIRVRIEEQDDGLLLFGQERHKGRKIGHVATVGVRFGWPQVYIKPAHAIAPRRDAHHIEVYCPVMQLFDVRRGKNLRLPIAPAVEMGDQVVGHVFRAGDELPRGKRTLRNGQVGGREWQAEPVAVTHRQTRFCLAFALEE